MGVFLATAGRAETVLQWAAPRPFPAGQRLIDIGVTTVTSPLARSLLIGLPDERNVVGGRTRELDARGSHGVDGVAELVSAIWTGLWSACPHIGNWIARMIADGPCTV